MIKNLSKMRMKHLLLALGIMISGAAAAQSTVKGYVFVDANGNGKKEGREHGLSGVAVSNGREVTVTDRNGRYELPIGQDNPVFVIKPSGYKTHVDENNLPQFYYLHKPNGSPQTKEPGVAPTGKLPRSVDFGLTAQEEEENFKILVFGDPQVRSTEEVDYFNRGIIAELENASGYPFGISLGDLVFDKPELYDPYKKAISKVGIPWYNVMGNHDVNRDAETDSLSDETFERHFGPSTYSFNYGKAHFIIIDNIVFPHAGAGAKYRGGINEAQLDFIKNDLKYVPKDNLVVLAFHIPIKNHNGSDAFITEEKLHLFRLLKDYPNTLSLSAHTHQQRQDFFTKEDGWLQEKAHHHFNVGTTCGNWHSGKLLENGAPLATMTDGTPKGYAILSISGNQYVVDYKAAGEPEDYKINIIAPKVVRKAPKTSAGIYANYFMGSEKDELMVRIDNGKWQKMNYTVDLDPSYVHLLHEWDFEDEIPQGRRPGNASVSTHLWRAPVPSDLEPGIHTIEVQVKDMFDRTITQKTSYRIVE